MSDKIENPEIVGDSEAWQCDSCDAEVAFEDNVCPNCGADISEVAEKAQAQPSTANAEGIEKNHLFVQRMAEPLYRARGWMKFLGVFLIIYGVLMVITIWGILICWILIWTGVVLISASNHIRVAFETDNEKEFHASLEKLGTYFLINGIGVLIGIFLVILAVIRFVTLIR